MAAHQVLLPSDLSPEKTLFCGAVDWSKSQFYCKYRFQAGPQILKKLGSRQVELLDPSKIARLGPRVSPTVPSADSCFSCPGSSVDICHSSILSWETLAKKAHPPRKTSKDFLVVLSWVISLVNSLPFLPTPWPLLPKMLSALLWASFPTPCLLQLAA